MTGDRALLTCNFNQDRTTHRIFQVNHLKNKHSIKLKKYGGIIQIYIYNNKRIK